jgi:hypothetical protein
VSQRDAIFIFGQDGTGKTTKAVELLQGYSRVLVLDAGFQQFPAIQARDLDGAVDALKEAEAFGTARPFRVSFTPLPDEYDLCFLLARDLGNCVFVMEEADRFDGMGPWQSEYVYRGRHWGVSLICLTIQPFAVPKDFRRILKEVYAFRTIEPSDVDYIESIVGPEAELLPTLSGPPQSPPFDYLKWSPYDGAKIIRPQGPRKNPLPADAPGSVDPTPTPVEVEEPEPERPSPVGDPAKPIT